MTILGVGGVVELADEVIGGGEEQLAGDGVDDLGGVWVRAGFRAGPWLCRLSTCPSPHCFRHRSPDHPARRLRSAACTGMC